MRDMMVTHELIGLVDPTHELIVLLYHGWHCNIDHLGSTGILLAVVQCLLHGLDVPLTLVQHSCCPSTHSKQHWNLSP